MFNYLKKYGILGNNARISDFILPHNKRSAYPLVDNKIKTHSLALKNGISSPELYFTINSYGELKKLHELFKTFKSAVIKPARGSQGNGILVINSIEWNENPNLSRFMTSRKNTTTYSDIEYHVSSILSGLYSLNGEMDQVLVQEKLDSIEDLKKLSFQGLPDIRVILFYGIPIMAMTRLPTQKSQGRGNLHQGAVGLGLRIKDGTVSGAIQDNKNITDHPDLKIPLFDLKVPDWNKVLMLASKCSELVNINYLGVDIVIDPEKGPMLLEMNARPGLSIQLANKAGLIPRLNNVNTFLKSRSKPSKDTIIKFQTRYNLEDLNILEKVNFGIENF